MINSIINVVPTLLHVHGEHGHHSGFAEFLIDTFGEFGHFLDEVILHGILDTLQLALFLFLTYLIIAVIEKKTAGKATAFMQKSGNYGAILGGLFGVIPQCGFSAAAANFYTGRVITVGTLIAVFLSTSDEMLPILLAGDIKISVIISILAYKMVVGIIIGLTIDLILKLMHKPQCVKPLEEEYYYTCDCHSCHCGDGVFMSSIRHTLSVSGYILLITWLINGVIFFVGEEKLGEIFVSIPVVSHFICALIGLIPNCAASVALTQFALKGLITSGAMLSGLFAGAGVGILVLFKTNKNWKENLTITGILVVVGVVFGLIADFIPILNVLN